MFGCVAGFKGCYSSSQIPALDVVESVPSDATLSSPSRRTINVCKAIQSTKAKFYELFWKQLPSSIHLMCLHTQ